MYGLTLARWQFGITTVYHFLFVPLRIGLVFIVATRSPRSLDSTTLYWIDSICRGASEYGAAAMVN